MSNGLSATRLAAEQKRAAWAAQFPWCFFCWRNHREPGHGIWWLETHEIERRSQARPSLVFSRVNLARACHTCHAGPVATMPHARQLAYAYFNDPERAQSIQAMLAEWLPIRCGSSGPDRVTVAEVEAELDPIGEHAPLNTIGYQQHREIRHRFLRVIR